MQSKFWRCSYVAGGTPIRSFTADPDISALRCSLRCRRPSTPLWAGRPCVIFRSVKAVREEGGGWNRVALASTLDMPSQDHCYCNHFILIHPYQPFLGLCSHHAEEGFGHASLCLAGVSEGVSDTVIQVYLSTTMQTAKRCWPRWILLSRSLSGLFKQDMLPLTYQLRVHASDAGILLVLVSFVHWNN